MEHYQVMFMLDPTLYRREDSRPSWKMPHRSIRPGRTSDLPYGEERALRVPRGR
jgi:hypothetical protein